ncbi:trna (cytosine-5-)-methyltransferase [Moniliophthora roreri MCA 2997]|uniref:Trna (Cytosine-5-)-methyltransferase n=1 Tax=Moniliophthora roreri (strain MCA 2997) TaxID=1381753 RepID=V2XHC7_MONRO|nr:trna (cytosine-5-)-methyltransferase [Moniliophthora roreri MCA 2997]
MGKKKRVGGQNRGKRTKNDEYRTDLLEKSDMRNGRFVAYYKAQNILPEEEWEPFLEAFRTPLPTTFRVAGSRLTANSLNKTITDVHVPLLSDVEFESQRIRPPVQIPWYPDGLAWQFNVPKKVLRKSLEFKKFHSFLVFETEVGNISRQEAVSMLPPLFLNVEPHHRVMDMCAAPGSKTAQLLEALHAQDTLTASSIPSGLLIANDSDYKRTHLLIHQSARLPSPALMVTNLDASNYPSMKMPSSGSKMEQLLFDRILCDVPCSGDGTLRKNLGIWKTWQPNDGNGLHGLQLRILQRAMKLLKTDGRIVYSTCSLNPVENEAVVAAALNANTDFHLVDVSSLFPSLQRRSGLKTWRPTADKAVKATYETYSAFVEADPQAAANTKLTEGHWPPENVEELNLERCMRIYPHLQDSGGFFVAVLERKQKMPSLGSRRENKRAAESASGTPEPETKKPRLTETTSDMEAADKPVASNTEVPMAITEEKEENKGGGGVFKEMPYTFLSKDDPTLLSCMDRLHLTAEFPSDNILVRNPEGDVVRSMYLTNSIVKAIVQNNDFTRIRLTAAGTKVFTRQEGAKLHEKLEETAKKGNTAAIGAQYRILGEGLPVVLPYVDPARIVEASIGTLKTLVESYYPLLESFEESFRNVMAALELGCHVVRFPPGELDGASLTHELVLPIWRSGVSLTLMIDKKAKNALSLRVFGKELPSTASAKRKADPGAEYPASTADSSLPIDNKDDETAESIEAETEDIVIPGL